MTGWIRVGCLFFHKILGHSEIPNRNTGAQAPGFPPFHAALKRRSSTSPHALSLSYAMSLSHRRRLVPGAESHPAQLRTGSAARMRGLRLFAADTSGSRHGDDFIFVLLL